MTEPEDTQAGEGLDPAQLAIVARRFDSVVREMTNTLLRTGRSTVLATVRDCSCAIVTADDQLLSAAEGLPVHTFGTHLQAASVRELHPDLREGDAFLHNDPYRGNTHLADHTILVPVFIEGEHLFTTCAKAHQADIGNSVPSTYHPLAQDIYEEGGLCFPAVRVQSGYEDVDDIIRMCHSRIRLPNQWYGDYLAMLGAARTGERRLKEMAQRYGKEVLVRFVKDWLDYSERRMVHAIQQLKPGEVTVHGGHDPFGPLPDGVPLQVKVSVDPAEARIEIDLRDNVDAVPAGVNQSKACAISNAMTGVLNVIGAHVPINAGTFRRLEVRLRENCVAGYAVHPTSCSLATTNIGDRIICLTQYALSQLGGGVGLAEGGMGLGPGSGVISGWDSRHDRPFINAVALSGNGGPATADYDGQLAYGAPCGAGLAYRDSVEVNEQRYPVLIRDLRHVMDSGGAGRRRGAPGISVEYGPRHAPMTVDYIMDGFRTGARGLGGGGGGALTSAAKLTADGAETMTGMRRVELLPGEWIRGVHAGGGGYGPAFEREPERVLDDVLNAFVSLPAAERDYGVVIVRDDATGRLSIDREATAVRRGVGGNSTTTPSGATP